MRGTTYGASSAVLPPIIWEYVHWAGNVWMPKRDPKTKYQNAIQAALLRVSDPPGFYFSQWRTGKKEQESGKKYDE